MHHVIDVLDAAGSRTAILTGVTRARLRERVNGICTLAVETLSGDAADYIVPGTTFLRVGTSGGPAPERATYRVIELTRARRGERSSVVITARHILADTRAELFTATVERTGATPPELMALVLGHSAFSAGTVEPDGTVPWVRFDHEPVWDCLMRICALTGGELSLDEETDAVSLMGRTGADNGVVFRYGLNLRGASRTVSTSRLANRIHGVGGGDPPLDLTGATYSGGAGYVENAASVAAWGLHEAACHEPALTDVVNLVATPALDGPFTDGLCADWTADGSPMLSRADAAGDVIHGGASQRVQGEADGEGVSQSVAVTPGEVYSLSATVIIASGTVRVAVLDGTSVYRRADAVTGTGLATVTVEGWKAQNDAVTVAVRQEGTGTSDFRVDSVQVEAGTSAGRFTVGRSADILWERSCGMLAARGEPEITYTVDLVDLYGEEGAAREALRFGPGDTVRVADPALGIDIGTRVMERETDLLRPWRVNVVLDNGARGLADVLEALREAQEEGVRRTRAALAESSRAAGTGSTRPGFGNLTMRFFGVISATA